MKRDDSSSTTMGTCKEISHKLDSLWGIRLYPINYITSQKEEADDVTVLSLANPLSSRGEVHTASTFFLQMRFFVVHNIGCLCIAVIQFLR